MCATACRRTAAGRLRTSALRTFLTTFDTVLPRPEVLPFVDDVNLFGDIQVRTRRRYRDTPDGDFDPHKYKEKVRRLIDEHVIALDLSQKIPPLRITDPAFRDHIAGIFSHRAKASEMEHAARHHVREHLDEDPVYYGKLSETDRRDPRPARRALGADRPGARGAGCRDQRRTQATRRTPGSTRPPSCRSTVRWPRRSTVPSPTRPSRSWRSRGNLLPRFAGSSAVVGFWDNPTKQDDLRKAIKRALDDSDLFTYASLDELAVELVALAKANQHRLS